MKKQLQFFLPLLLLILIFKPNFSQAQNALYFDGTNDNVLTTYPGVTGGGNRTFEAWIKISSGITASSCILDYGLNAVGSRNTFMVTTGYQLSYIAGGTNTNFGSNGTPIVPNVWTHVAMVQDNGVGYMYINGVQVGTGNVSGVSTPAGNANMTIGQRVSGGSLPFKGAIDEVRVWNVARSATEIQASMNSEFCVIPTSLKAYYQFNQGTASGTNTGLTTLNDNSGNAHNGTLNSFALTGATSNWVAGATLTSNILNAGTLAVTNCVPFVSLGNKTITATGMYQDTVKLTTGCDSIYTLDFTALSASSSSFNASVCATYTSPSGKVFTTSGMHMDTIHNALGCDSVISINLNVYSNSLSNISKSVCNTYTSPSGKVFTTTGMYLDTIPSSIGCDSVIAINLTVNKATSSNIYVTECLSYTSPAGNVYTATGVYTNVIQNSAGCDSTIMINLIIKNSTLINQNISACDSYVSPSGKTWTSSGVYQDTLFGGITCARIYTINLLVGASVSTSVTENVCGTYTSGLGKTYTTSGIYTEAAQTVNGCDSTVTLNLTMQSDITVSQNGPTLSANQNGATYQWYNCADQTAVAGATAQSFSANANGSYYVEIQSGTCTANSACYVVKNVGIYGVNNSVIALYPNPTSGLLTIELDDRYNDVSVRVLSIDGKMVQSLDLNNTNHIQFNLEQAKGLYTILVYTDGSFSNFKVLKLD